MTTDSVRLSPDAIRQLRTVAEAVARRNSSAPRFTIEIAERFNLRTGERALNILAISDDPDWADTDLNTTHPWSAIRERQPLARGRALFDLFIYERRGVGETGDLVCCVQVEIDREGLTAIHADSEKNIWCREGPLPSIPTNTAP